MCGRTTRFQASSPVIGIQATRDYRARRGLLKLCDGAIPERCRIRAFLERIPGSYSRKFSPPLVRFRKAPHTSLGAGTDPWAPSLNLVIALEVPP